MEVRQEVTGHLRWHDAQVSLVYFLLPVGGDQFTFAPSLNTVNSYQHLPIYLRLFQMINHTADNFMDCLMGFY